MPPDLDEIGVTMANLVCLGWERFKEKNGIDEEALARGERGGLHDKMAGPEEWLAAAQLIDPKHLGFFLIGLGLVLGEEHTAAGAVFAKYLDTHILRGHVRGLPELN